MEIYTACAITIHALYSMIKILNQIIGIKFVAENACILISWLHSRRIAIFIINWIVSWFAFHLIAWNKIYRCSFILFLPFLSLPPLIENILMNFSFSDFVNQIGWLGLSLPAGRLCNANKKVFGQLILVHVNFNHNR